MDNLQKIDKLFAILDESKVYTRAIGKLEFDMECCAPQEGLAQAGEDMAALGRQVYKLTHSKTYRDLVTSLHENGEGLTPVRQKAVDYYFEQYDKTRHYSAKFSYELDRAAGVAYGEWLKAKKAGDFSLFRDSLARIVTLSQKAVALRRRPYRTPYDGCLSDYEPGGSEAELDSFFEAVKARTVPLIRRIVREGKPVREDFLTRSCPIPQQEAFSRFLLKEEGLRESALTLMTTEHPFTTSFGSKDVRVTTHYYENLFLSNIFSTLHEGGHALFMQNEPEEFELNHASEHMSNAMHECISRFYENLIGRSEAFIHYIYPKLKDFCPEVMEGVTERELYGGVNAVHPSLIRIEADELTYCLHIIIRYEIEKALMNGGITVDEVPALWNEKYREYLGVEVPDDGQGCLQDVHWTSGFGYFPSYALGNAYGAQILAAMKRDFDVDAAVSEGRLDKVLDWLKERVFSCASILTPDEWIRRITGEGLNANYYLDYLESKFTALYSLN